MCGIVGVLGAEPAAPRLLEALRRLEYRGYDSAGIATLVDGRIARRRAAGKLDRLAARLTADPLAGCAGIGHTRWATHGGPSETNAHPIATARVAVVHNGIIENHRALRTALEADGHLFETETDTEVVAQLLTRMLADGRDPEAAAAETLARLHGAFALAMLFAGHDDLLIVARRGSPLAIGHGEGEMFVGSDALALAPWTSRVTHLEEGDWAVLTRAGAAIRDASGAGVSRPVRHSASGAAPAGKAGHRHFMQKEINEQPAVLGDTIAALTDPRTGRIALPALPVDFAQLPRLTIVACGTAHLAGMVAKYWFETLARLPVELDVASEFRYRQPPMPEGGAMLVVSQSGETADTLAALRYARGLGQPILSIVNVPESTIARESDAVLPTLAGPEIGVASTKAFTTQLAVLAALAIGAAEARGTIAPAEGARLAAALRGVSEAVARLLAEAGPAIRAAAEAIAVARDVLYLGRGTAYPIALEGALKLKEISYIHAEGYAAGEMKHGPIALIDAQVPVVILAPPDPVFGKTLSNLAEVRARGGRILLFSDADGLREAGPVETAVALPAIDPVLAPILYAVPVQLLAYHAAVARGTDVDQPRNLAKSVTVE